MKTHFKKLRNPNYCGSWDLTDKNGNYTEQLVTIKKVVVEEVHDGNGGKENCTVIHLEELKPMVANSTNLKMISKIAKSNFIEDWVGVKICLYVKKVRAFGEFHDALRVKDANAMVKSTKPTLINERLNNAIKAIEDGNYTVEALESGYDLTEEQESILFEFKSKLSKTKNK